MAKPEVLGLTGVVTRGRGVAKGLFASELVSGALPDGESLFPGSLNIVLDLPVKLDFNVAIPFAGGSRYLWPVSISGVDVPVFVYRWKGCPLHVLEIVSTQRLRDKLGLEDGFVLELSLPCHYVSNVNRIAVAVWWLLWRGRESWYYTKERYKRLVYLSRLNRFCSQ